MNNNLSNRSLECVAEGTDDCFLYLVLPDLEFRKCKFAVGCLCNIEGISRTWVISGRNHLEWTILVKFHLAEELLFHVFGLESKTLYYHLHKVRRRESLHFVLNTVEATKTHHTR